MVVYIDNTELVIHVIFTAVCLVVINDVKRIEGFTAYLESIGIRCDYATRGRTEINEYIDSGYLYKVEESIGEETEIILTFNDKSITLSESECNKKMQDLEKYVKFYLFN